MQGHVDVGPYSGKTFHEPVTEAERCYCLKGCKAKTCFIQRQVPVPCGQDPEVKVKVKIKYTGQSTESGSL